MINKPNVTVQYAVEDLVWHDRKSQGVIQSICESIGCQRLHVRGSGSQRPDQSDDTNLG